MKNHLNKQQSFWTLLAGLWFTTSCSGFAYMMGNDNKDNDKGGCQGSLCRRECDPADPASCPRGYLCVENGRCSVDPNINPRSLDTDGDGVTDDKDGCIADNEDFDNFEDTDGCPDIDNDKDGVLDKDDLCPNKALDAGYPSTRKGCPEEVVIPDVNDQDKDGVLDANDLCPLQIEDRDQYQDSDGCIDADNDQDNIPDARDKCPCVDAEYTVDKCASTKENYNGFADTDGCPDPETPPCLKPNVCGNCSANCINEQLGGPNSPLPNPSANDGVIKRPDGTIALSETSAETTVQAEFAWPSNDVEGTISRIDTKLNREVGRYATVLKKTIPGVVTCPRCAVWNDLDHNNRPSRSTVDPKTGNAYVANRAHALPNDSASTCTNNTDSKCYGSVTKFGFYDAKFCDPNSYDESKCQCKDQNGNRKIETSMDCDGQGIGDNGLCKVDGKTDPSGTVPNGIEIAKTPDLMTAAKAEFWGEDDECILWTKELGNPGDNPRAMAIDASGKLWVGMFASTPPRFYKLDPDKDGLLLDPDYLDMNNNGPLTAESGVTVTGNPYGAVIDSQNKLTYVHRHKTGQIERFDVQTGKLDPGGLIAGNPVGAYGITVDSTRNIWVASWDDKKDSNGKPETHGALSRYKMTTLNNVTTTEWTHFSASLDASNDKEWRGRGLTTALKDGRGYIWAVFYNKNDSKEAFLVKFDDQAKANDGPLKTINLNMAPPSGKLPCSSKTPIGVGIGYAGSVWVVNQRSDNVCKFTEGNTADTDSTNDNDELFGIKVGSAPYTYSDFTGYLLANLTRQEGSYSVVFPGCITGKLEQWAHLSYQVETPGASSIEVTVRGVPTSPELITNKTPYGPLLGPNDVSWRTHIADSILGSKNSDLEVIFNFKADPNNAANIPKLIAVEAANVCGIDE